MREESVKSAEKLLKKNAFWSIIQASVRDVFLERSAKKGAYYV